MHVANLLLNNHKNAISVSSSTSSARSVSSIKFTPNFSRISAAPLLLETLRFPCFATGIPAAAITKADVVEILKVPTSSPPAL